MGAQLQFARGKRGFSLIEQVVAIASVAVVSAVVVPAVVNQLDKSEISRIESDLRSLEKAAKDFRADVTYWPGEILQLKDPITSTPDAVNHAATGDLDAFGSAILSTVFADWKGPYFEPKAFANVGTAAAPQYKLTSAAGTFFTNELTVESLDPNPSDASTQTYRYLKVRLNNVDQEDAEKLSESLDGEQSLTTGRVQWTATSGSKGVLTYFAGPVN